MFDNPYPQVLSGPPRPNEIIQPRVFSMPPGRSALSLKEPGLCSFPLKLATEESVTNDEGGQPCEFLCADPNRNSAPLNLGINCNCDAEGIKALLASTDLSLRGLRTGLEAWALIRPCKGPAMFGPARPAIISR